MIRYGIRLPIPGPFYAYIPLNRCRRNRQCRCANCAPRPTNLWGILILLFVLPFVLPFILIGLAWNVLAWIAKELWFKLDAFVYVWRQDHRKTTTTREARPWARSVPRN